MNICCSVSRTIAFLHRRTATEMQKQRNFMLYASTSLRIFISPLSVLFSHFLPLSVSLPSLSLNSFPYLSSSADGFSLGLWRRLHSLLSDLHNCIDEQCLFNNVTGRFLTWHRKPLTLSKFQQKRMHQLLAFLLYPYYVKQMFVMINYDRTYDISMHFCVFNWLNFFSKFFALAYVIS